MYLSQQREFESYLEQMSDRQLQGVYDREKSAGRKTEMLLCRLEAAKRSIRLEEER